ncbi:phospholipase D-like domain-containing protein [Methylocucumis oryzae]|uniref:phospholipase D-like domain-containing protein n=1 Tax=Methylocucumis oryzae TaxID=1632867 RepID=UPI001955248C|nr:phospholipase D-like domain-containing protein [Methylocucumis oryzae]
MIYSSIRDNHAHGSVGDFLKEHLTADSSVSIVSAYFTLFAYQQLKDKLDNIEELRFLFGEPTFIKAIDPDNAHTRAFKIEDDSLVIATEKIIHQKAVARQCSQWLRDKAQIRSMVKPNFLHGKLYHITQASGIEKAIAGSSNFTVNGLGLGGSKNIELNLVIDSDRDRKELKHWFDELWHDKTGLVEDVKAQVLNYLEQLYRENSPEFIYFKTLYHISVSIWMSKIKRDC